MRAKIIGTGSYLPPKVVTNDDLAKLVDTSDEWIRERTGIRERRVTDEKTATSDLAVEAAKAALTAAKVSPDEIDLIIVCTCTPDLLFPATACILQDKLGIKNAAAFDLSAACSGFNFGLAVGSSLIENGAYKKALLVGADTLTKYLDWTDRGTCILFGDGAGAVVLSATAKEEGVLKNYLKAEGLLGKYLIMPGGGSRDPEGKGGRVIRMAGREVFKFAVRVLGVSVEEILAIAKLTPADIDLLIPHQANIRIIDHVAKKMGLSKEKVYVNLQKYGNTSAASIPIALDEALKEGRIKSGDLVVLAGFGAGLTYGANIIRW
ncbi:3-oxoacyl-ACP synthase [candidate division WOR-1 bacterium RIFCSPHIGHO2_02_FULL_53_26]|nr:MAG: 3-oxoacyl-ACP synthase [candidate division WOR-1 bacterium RIFCSPHIGHO2_02_FULL_53_26]